MKDANLHPIQKRQRVLGQLGPQRVEVRYQQLTLKAIARYNRTLDHVVPQSANDQQHFEPDFHLARSGNETLKISLLLARTFNLNSPINGPVEVHVFFDAEGDYGVQSQRYPNYAEDDEEPEDLHQASLTASIYGIGGQEEGSFHDILELLVFLDTEKVDGVEVGHEVQQAGDEVTEDDVSVAHGVVDLGFGVVSHGFVHQGHFFVTVPSISPRNMRVKKNV